MTHTVGVGELRRVATDLGSGTLPVEGKRLRVGLPGWDLADIASRVAVGALFLLLALRIAENTLETGRITGLLLLASELLVVILMIIRRPTGDVDRRWPVRLLTVLSMVGPPMVRPIATAAGTQDLYTAVVSACGLALVIASKVALGRSFGLVPANRGVVSSGPYRLVRHPIYLGYLVTHMAFLVANPTTWNFLALGAADIALIVRSLREEQVLDRDTAYVAYKQRVRWRLVPQLF